MAKPEVLHNDIGHILLEQGGPAGIVQIFFVGPGKLDAGRESVVVHFLSVGAAFLLGAPDINS